MVEIALRCIPPTATAQGKRVMVTKTGIRFFKAKDMQGAVEFLTALLAPRKPTEPVLGPIALEFIAVWPYTQKDASNKAKKALCDQGELVWHENKPDLDNWAKELQDLLVKLRFIEDDKNVVQIQHSKVRGKDPGIIIIVHQVGKEELDQVAATIQRVQGGQRK